MEATVPRRRLLVVVAAAGLEYVSTGALAQSKQRVFRIGVIATDAGNATAIEKQLAAELSRRGFNEGTLVFVRSFAPVNASGGNLDRVAGEIVQANVDLIFTHGAERALAAKRRSQRRPARFRRGSHPRGSAAHPRIAPPA